MLIIDKLLYRYPPFNYNLVLLCYFPYTFHICHIMPQGQEEEARQLIVERLSSNAVQTYCVRGTLKYELPKADVSLSHIFETMTAAKRAVSIPEILDWAVASATLEEVFIKLVKDHVPNIRA